MKQLQKEDLFTLEIYAQQRSEFRARVMEHKQHRRLSLGEHVIILFENSLTVQYQIQEMLRIERIFEGAGIQEELDAYNPLIPDGSNWKATMMIEYSDPEERRDALARLIGIEDLMWVQVDGADKVVAVADEDIDRSTDTKTSAVHFLRFELDAAMVEGLKSGASLNVGSSHPQYPVSVEITDAMRESLIADLD